MMAVYFDFGFTARTYVTVDGLRLHARDYGGGDPRTRDRLPVFCLPGLTRNSRDFHQLALLLAGDPDEPRRILALDYRGRGQSQRDETGQSYTLLAEAQDVLAAASQFGVERAVFIGTSRGGLTLHLLAEMAPSLLAAVILNDIGPVIEPEGLRQIRAYLSSDRRPSDWTEAAAMLQTVHGDAFPALSEQDWCEKAQAIYTDRSGALVADFDPEIARQLSAADLDQPLPHLWPQFDAFRDIPLMTIRGEKSALLGAATLSAMAKRHSGMTALTVKGQGHAPLLHLGEIPAAIRAFLSAR